MRIALVHGFNVSDGGVGAFGYWHLALRLDGHDARLVDYGWVGPLRVRLENMDVVDRLAAMRPDVIIGHSNGAAIAWRYARTGAPLHGVVCVQPALQTDTAWPANVRRVVCLYNPADWAVLLGRVYRWINPVSWVIEHPWGAAGRYGFERTDGRFCQINTARAPVHPYRGHSIRQLYSAGGAYWAQRCITHVEEPTCDDSLLAA